MKPIATAIFLALLGNSSFAQKMTTEEDHKIGIKGGIALGWLSMDGLTQKGNADWYRPRLREGIFVSGYDRIRLTNLINKFNYRAHVNNWYLQLELGAGFRGGNFKYFSAPTNAEGSHTDYKHSDTGAFRKYSTFAAEAPFMLVWDWKNKQTFNILFGAKPHYVFQVELYKGNDNFPLYFNDDYYYDKVAFKNWGWSGVLGWQYCWEHVGVQMMFNYGLTSIDNHMTLTYNPSTQKTIRYFPKKVIQYGVDMFVTF